MTVAWAKDADKNVRRYLERHAEAEVRTVKASAQSWAHVVVLPACDELNTVFTLLESLGAAAKRTAKRVLVIVVVNAPEDAKASVHEANAALWSRFTQARSEEAVSDLAVEPLVPIRQIAYAGLDVWCLDRWRPGRRLSPKQGVGHARKIGADMAVALWEQGKLSNPWIYSCDADVIVGEDYFETQPPEQAIAATLPFRHTRPQGALGVAQGFYELWLRYHVLMMAKAGSKYAFHTLGSALMVSVAGYAAVGGFPRRNATEDFYLLNKLAKVGKIARLKSRPITIQCRASTRVPVGTGPAVAEIMDRREAGESFEVIHPDSYVALGCLVRGFRALASHRDLTRFEISVRRESSHPMFVSTALEQASLQRACQRALAASTSASVVHRHLETYFDGLRSVQWLHRMEQLGIRQCGWQQALQMGLGVLCTGAEEEALDSASKALFRLEASLPLFNDGKDPVVLSSS